MRPLCLIACVFCFARRRPGPPSRRQARLDETQRAFFKDYCVECHGPRTQEGKLRLDDISFVIESVEQADRWQKILNQLNSGEMPPEDAKQPERERKTEFLDALSQTLVTGAQDHRRPGGPHHPAAAQSARIPEHHPRSARRGDRRPRFAGRRRHGHVRYRGRVALHVERPDRAIPRAGSPCARRALCATTSAGQQQPFKAREEAEVFGNKRMNGLFEADEGDARQLCPLDGRGR